MQLPPVLLCIISSFSAVQFRLPLRAMWYWTSLSHSSNMATRLERQAIHKWYLWSMHGYNVMWCGQTLETEPLQLYIVLNYNHTIDLRALLQTSNQFMHAPNPLPAPIPYGNSFCKNYICLTLWIIVWLLCLVLVCSLVLSSQKLKKALLKLWRSSLLESRGLDEKKLIGLFKPVCNN